MMKYNKTFEYDNVILNTGQFAYGMRNLIQIILEYSDLPGIDRNTDMPDGARMVREKLTYAEIEDVTDFSKEDIQISFDHKTNGRYFFWFHKSGKSISLYVSCVNSVLLNQIDEVVKAILSPNFSKSAFDKKISEMSNINADSKNQGEENFSQKIDSTIDLSNANLKDSTINISNTKIEDSIVNSSNKTIEKSSSKKLLIQKISAAIIVIAAIIAILQYFDIKP